MKFILIQIFKYMFSLRKYHTGVVMLALFAIGLLLIAAQSSVVAPFIYAVF